MLQYDTPTSCRRCRPLLNKAIASSFIELHTILRIRERIQLHEKNTLKKNVQLLDSQSIAVQLGTNVQIYTTNTDHMYRECIQIRGYSRVLLGNKCVLLGSTHVQLVQGRVLLAFNSVPLGRD